ncbi:E3 ubiquitin protein ligase DRIP2-like isoform X2 [Juglans microcarpa x Juglans regia]|uniref:E3 ubiquitin protein ligase DRIP2-like isoform X2 n=1 Tax=Juglans microcarpa x Juglans regia TaxID=2249226 RepID=UPI001B7EEA53|nr:E3 ubiquitin protein ligase DRIP2-like isoform X2 [Juglans microcarpa x Juglans regia]
MCVWGQRGTEKQKMMMAGQVVKLQWEKLAVCMTCPLCNKLFKDATTISECLHTFCRKCIYKKLTSEELNHCPVCNKDLGCAPLEKLRADHNVQDLRARIFPFVRKKANAPEVVPSVPFSGKRKERSLSPFRASIPRIKCAARKCLPLLEPTLFVDEPVEKEGDDKKVGDHRLSFSSSETLHENLQNRRQVEAASKTKSIKFTMHGMVVKPALPKAKIKGHGNKSKGHGDDNGSMSAPSSLVKTRKFHGVRQRRAAVSEGLINIPGQALIDVDYKNDRRFSPIWFSLVASNDQEGDSPLPQISSCYLRVRDGSLPVSFIKKYLVKKLDLDSEAEVEILLRGQPIISTQQFHDLVDLWLQTKPMSERIQTSMGCSAKEFVIVLSYGRKIDPMNMLR